MNKKSCNIFYFQAFELLPLKELHFERGLSTAINTKIVADTEQEKLSVDVESLYHSIIIVTIEFPSNYVRPMAVELKLN